MSNSAQNRFGVPAMESWEKAQENDKGFVSKWKHEDTGALFAIRRVNRGLFLFVSPNNNGKFEPVSAIVSSNLTQVVNNTITSKLSGPICGAEDDPTFSADSPKGCLGTGVFFKANGEEGSCFRCKGKGYVNADDVKRNKAYDAKRSRSSNGSVDMGDASI